MSSGAKHAKPPQLDDLAALIQRLAEEFMATQFAAEHATTALDGFFAGWKAAERYYDKTRGRSEDPAS